MAETELCPSWHYLPGPYPADDCPRRSEHAAMRAGQRQDDEGTLAFARRQYQAAETAARANARRLLQALQTDVDLAIADLDAGRVPVIPGGVWQLAQALGRLAARAETLEALEAADEGHDHR